MWHGFPGCPSSRRGVARQGSWRGPCSHAGRRPNMHYLQNVQTGISALHGIGLLITTGCGDVDQSGTDTTASDNIGTETDALRGQHWYRPPKTGTGGASAAGGTA